MDKALFEDLVSSLKEAEAISKGKAPASRRFDPTGPAAALLKIVSAAPGVALKALHA